MVMDQIEREIAGALGAGNDLESPGSVMEVAGALPSCFAVSDLAAATVGAACAEVSAFASPDDNATPPRVDRRLASYWFQNSIYPVGWELPPVWDDIAGVYRTSDGFIRLHTNAPHHKAAALAVLDCSGDRETVSEVVGSWNATDLEKAVVARGGCAAEFRSLAQWAEHPQGMAVAQEPLIRWRNSNGYGDASVTGHSRSWNASALLQGIRVLDLTRVLAGPVATRFLAAFGADVLRIDPPGWDEGVVVPDITVGKRCATLDLKTSEGLERLKALLRDADLLVHGYRPDALARLGLDERTRREINPALIDVGLCAYGWTGPWASRRGFDSLVQMSCGIAHEGMRQCGGDAPVPLPVQALDHATGYLLVAAAVRALRVLQAGGPTLSARLSLARTAQLLIDAGDAEPQRTFAALDQSSDTTGPEHTDWGEARRLRFPASFDNLKPSFRYPARRFHTSSPHWAQTTDHSQ